MAIVGLCWLSHSFCGSGFEIPTLNWNATGVWHKHAVSPSQPGHRSDCVIVYAVHQQNTSKLTVVEYSCAEPFLYEAIFITDEFHSLLLKNGQIRRRHGYEPSTSDQQLLTIDYRRLCLTFSHLRVPRRAQNPSHHIHLAFYTRASVAFPPCPYSLNTLDPALFQLPGVYSPRLPSTSPESNRTTKLFYHESPSPWPST